MFIILTNAFMTYIKIVNKTFKIRFTNKTKYFLQGWMGSTRKDEMCKFYMMYWVDGPEVMSQSKRSYLLYFQM